MRSSIYSLSDPRVGDVRYVGKTKRKLGSRVSQHIYLCSKHRNRLYDWLLSLKRDGIRPVVQELQSCEGDSWREAECQWISYFRSIGANLVNASDGGQGPSGIKRPDLADANRIRFTGKKLSPEHRAAVVASLVHKQTPEAIARRAESQRGKKRSLTITARMSEARNANGTTSAQLDAVYKMHEGNRGKERSTETKQKIADAVRRFHASKELT